MKKFLLILISSLILSSCSTNSKYTQSFEPVSCSSIAKQAASNVPVLNIELPCTDGKSSIVLNEVRGPAIVNAWASWCDPCKQEIPLFNQIAKIQNKTFQVIGINVEERNRNEGKNFAERMGMHWPQLYDQNGITKSLFGLGIPTTIFINEQGEIVYKKMGKFESLNDLKKCIYKYLPAEKIRN